MANFFSQKSLHPYLKYKNSPRNIRKLVWTLEPGQQQLQSSYTRLHWSSPCAQNTQDYACTELGTRQYCRDNVTMFSSHKVVCYCNMTIHICCGHSIFRHRDINIFRMFSCPQDSFTLFGCRVVVLYSCREAKTMSRAQLCSCTLYSILILSYDHICT